MFKRSTELIRAGSSFRSATDAVQTRNHIINLLSPHQLANALQITITPTQEEHLLDDVVLIGRHINQL